MCPLLLAALATVGCRSAEPPDRLFAEANALQSKYEKDASQRAILIYRSALAGWKRQGDLPHAAKAGQRIGETYEQLGSLHESLRAYLDALTLAQASGQRLLESELRSDVGVAQCLAADRENALQDAERQCRVAMDLARASDGKREEAKALNCFGEVDYLRGNLDRALDFYR